MEKIRKITTLTIATFMIFLFIVSSIFSISFINTPNSVYKNNNILANNDGTINKEGLGSDTNIPNSQGTIVNSWWNESYQFRKRIEVQNSLSYQRDVPVDLQLSFDAGDCHVNSVRIVKYDNDVWTPIPSQVWNVSKTGDYIDTATVTFVANDMDPGTHVFYVYYDPADLKDPTDLSGLNFEAAVNTNHVNINWTDDNGKNYRADLDKNKGVYNLIDDYAKNYHTENSTAPGMAEYEEDLVGYWNFDQSNFEEQTQHVAQGTAGHIDHGNIYYAPGKFGQAAFFDGSSDYVSINMNQALYGGSTAAGWTMMAWVYLQGSGERIIASWDRSEYWRFSVDGSNRAYFSSFSNNIDDMYSVSTIPNNEWHHIAFVYDPSASKKYIYIDGVLDSSRTAHSGNPLGAGRSITRYGFFGTGSESTTFDGTTGPNSWYYGGMDEVRFYQRVLDVNEIQRAKDNLPQTTSISAVPKEVTNGNVLAVYDVEWYDTVLSPTLTMTTKDTYWFYRGMNAYKVNRTIYFNQIVINQSFAAWNTLYNWDPNDPLLDYEDYYYYDGNMHEGHSNVDFTVENYTVLYDYDGTEHSTAVGLFLTKIGKTHENVQFDNIYWRIDVDSTSNLINFIPGNETVLNTVGSGSTYAIQLEFWEYIENDLTQFDAVPAPPVDPSTAGQYFDNYYTSLKTPVVYTVGEKENAFFNLEINCKDHDGFDVENLNVTLYNVTKVGNPHTFELIGSKLTDSNGNTSFSQLPAYNYSVNVTYKPFAGEPEIFLGTFNLTLNQTETTYLNTRILNLELGLARAVFHLQEYDTQQKIVGAEVKFSENVSETWNDLGSIFSDDYGNVTFIWRNYTENVGNISLNVTFSGSHWQINLTDKVPVDNEVINITSIKYYTLSVKIGTFETQMELTDLTPVNAQYGVPLQYRVHYEFNLSNVITNIDQALVAYSIQYKGDTLYSSTFPSLTDSDGNSSVTIDYASLIPDIIAGRGYTLVVTVSKSGFTPLVDTLNFQLENITSTLTNTSTSQSNYWGESISLSVDYKNGSGVGIDDADVNYYVVGIPSISGDCTKDGSGSYSLKLDTTLFGSTGNYIVRVTAFKKNYQVKYQEISIRIDEISTNLISAYDSYDLYWQDNFTLKVQYNNTLRNIEIDNATVTWSVVQNPSVTGVLKNTGNGWYEAEVNSTQLNLAAPFNIEISAITANHESNSIRLPININEIYTLINGSTTKTDSVTIYRTEQRLFYFNYTYRVGAQGSSTYRTVENATFATYEWEDKSNPLINGTGTLFWENGLYVLDFDTETRPIGEYSLTIRLQELNFRTRVAVMFVEVIPLEFKLDFGTSDNFNPADNVLSYTVEQDSDIVINFKLFEGLNDSAMESANIYWLRDGLNENVTFNYIGNGVYQTSVKADADAFYQQQLITGKIFITAKDHETVTISVRIIVTMPEIAPGIPTFYAILAIGFLGGIVVVLGTYHYIQVAGIPEFIRKCNDVEREIRKKKKIDARELITPSKEAVVYSMLAEAWNIIDLDFGDTIGYHPEPKEIQKASKKQKDSSDKENRNPDELNNGGA